MMLVARTQSAAYVVAAREVPREMLVGRRSTLAAPVSAWRGASPLPRLVCNQASAAVWPSIARDSSRFASAQGWGVRLSCSQEVGGSISAARNQLASSVARWLTRGCNGRSAARPAAEPQIR